MGLLEGKTAVVTGGSTGIGLASAARLVAEGAYVFITGRRKTELDAAVQSLGASATAAVGDIADLDGRERLYVTVRDRGRGVGGRFGHASVADGAGLEALAGVRFGALYGLRARGMLFPDQKALHVHDDEAGVMLDGEANA